MALLSEDMSHLNQTQQDIIRTAQEWGYGKQNIYQRPRLWHGKRILDVGMGNGPHSIPFIVGGASAYIGVDPVIRKSGTRQFIGDTKHNQSSRNEFPYSPEEITHHFPNIHLYAAKFENVATEIKAHDADVVLLSSVTEHLNDPLSVFQAIFEATRPGTHLWLTHGNYYSWTGHHQQPRSVQNWDLQNIEQGMNVDWQHLHPDHLAWSMPHLNRMRLQDLRDLIDTFFEIKEWHVQIEAWERLTNELRQSLKAYSLEELLGRMIHVCAIRRDQKKETHLTERQFHHPDTDYMADKEYTYEGANFLDTSNLVFFTQTGTLASHQYNSNAGQKIIENLFEGDTMVVEKFPDRLGLTVHDVLRPQKGNASVVFKDDIPMDFISNQCGRQEWRITSYTKKLSNV